MTVVAAYFFKTFYHFMPMKTLIFFNLLSKSEDAVKYYKKKSKLSKFMFRRSCKILKEKCKKVNI